eukprot:6465458-Amphidinium_carterae.1
MPPSRFAKKGTDRLTGTVTGWNPPRRVDMGRALQTTSDSRLSSAKQWCTRFPSSVSLCLELTAPLKRKQLRWRTGPNSMCPC